MGRIVGLVFEDVVVEEVIEETAAADLSDLTKAELKAKLDAAGIEYDDRMTKDELIALQE